MLKAQVVNLRELLSGWQEQFIVPVFQRSYAPNSGLWQSIWDDFLELDDSRTNRQHFAGTLITMRVGLSPESRRKSLIVDGQQRLVTFSILLAAIRDFSDNENKFFKDVINEHLWIHSENAPLLQEPKLQLTTNDHEAFLCILKHEKCPKSNVSKAYNFFVNRLASISDTALDYYALTNLLLKQFVFIHTELDEDDDPYSIITNLNSGRSQSTTKASVNPFPDASDDEIRFLESQRANYQKFSQAPELMALISSGENAETEFKEGACVSPYSGNLDTKMREQVVKSVAAFMNSKIGGTLLIGVADSGEIKGINHEYPVANKSKSNWDGYSLFICDLLNSSLAIDTPFQFYVLSQYTIDGKDICCIRVQPSTSPVYVNKKLYVRAGNQSLDLQGPDLLAYVKDRWNTN
jgi:hypothetical protein